MACMMRVQRPFDVVLTAYCKLRARRALLQFKDFPLRTRRALSLYKYGDNALPILAIAPFWFSTERL